MERQDVVDRHHSRSGRRDRRAARGRFVHEPDVLRRGRHAVRHGRGRVEDVRGAMGRPALVDRHQPESRRRAVVRHARRCRARARRAASPSAATRPRPAPLQTLIERWNGTTWSVAASPSQGAALAGELLGVSCSSATSCFAVGDRPTPPRRTAHPLSERWDGKTWSVVTPVPYGYGRTVNQLPRGLVHRARRTASAVGYRPGVRPRRLRCDLDPCGAVERPAVGGRPRAPTRAGPRAASPRCRARARPHCVAVGRFTNSVFERSLSNLRHAGRAVERHDAGRRCRAPTRSTRRFEVLNGVSCTGAASCFAVGNVMTAPGRNNTLGAALGRYGVVDRREPEPGRRDHQPARPACRAPSATNCVAVGRYTTSTGANAADAGPFKTLVEQWNGTTWSIVASPNPAGTTFARLDRVSCTATERFCMAVGVASTTVTGTDHPMAERWNGTAWTLVAVGPRSGRSYHTIGLSGVSCSSSTHCIAVFGYSPDSTPRG